MSNITDAPTTDQPTDTDTPPADRTFTQEDVNRIMADQKRKLLADQPDLADLRAKAARLDEIEEANKSELQRLQDALADAQTKASTAMERAQRALVRAAVVAEAQRAGAVDPDAVLAMLPKDAVTIGDDDQVTGADEAVKALLDAKPYLVGKPTRPTPGSADGGQQSNKPAQWTREDIKGKTPEQINTARQAGLLASLMSGE
jgi:hypothetical protein